MADTKAVRYFTVPQDINIPAGIGYSPKGAQPNAGGPMSFSSFFTNLCSQGIAKKDNFEHQARLITAFRNCAAGDRVEMPEDVWATFLDAMPRFLAHVGGAPDLYAEVMPFMLAVQRAPHSRPAE